MAEEGSIVFPVDMNVDKAEMRLASLKSSIKKVMQQIDQTGIKKSALESQAEAAKKAFKEASRILKIMQQDLESEGSNPERYVEIRDAIQEQESLVQRLEQEWTNIEQKLAPVTADYEAQKLALQNMREEYTGIVESMQGAADNSEKIEENVANTDREITNIKSGDGLGKAFSSAEKSASRFFKRIKGMASRVLIFSVIMSTLRSIKSYLTDAISKNDEFSRSFAQLKASAMALIQPLTNFALPYIIAAVQFLTRAMVTLAGIVSKLFGSSLEQSIAAAKALNDEADGMDDLSKSAKKATKAVAGFDTVQTLSFGEDSSADINSSITGATAAPDFSGLIGNELSAIESMFTGLALLALGAILAFSGAAIPLGIALMAAGAAFMYGAIKEDWGAISEELQGSTGAILAIIISALLSLGAVLLFSGAAIGLGLGLITVGAVGLATVITANWNYISETLQGPIGKVVALVSGALLCLGAILLFTGAAFALGLGMMVVGAAGLVATIAANWNYISDMLQGPIGKVVAIVSGALIVLGIILLFTGAGIPLGIGLLVAGAVGLATTIAANWNFIIDKIKSIISVCKDVIGKAIEWVKDKFTAVKDFILGIFDNIKDFFGGIGSAIGSFFSFDWIPFSSPSPGIPVMPVPDIGDIAIPLANGGLIPRNREFITMLGDNKREDEVVSPISAIKQAVKDALLEVGGTAGGDIHITLELDGRVVAKNTVKHVNQMTRENGRPVLIG